MVKDYKLNDFVFSLSLWPIPLLLSTFQTQTHLHTTKRETVKNSAVHHILLFPIPLGALKLNSILQFGAVPMWRAGTLPAQNVTVQRSSQKGCVLHKPTDCTATSLPHLASEGPVTKNFWFLISLSDNVTSLQKE